jgi:Holliday junction resolvase RusA-like endonuclease
LLSSQNPREAQLLQTAALREDQARQRLRRTQQDDEARPRSPGRPDEVLGDLVAFIEFYFKRPKTHYKKGQLKSDAPQFVLKTPDVDNCVKFALDALQPRVVFDDKIVTKVVAEKKWCDGASAECTTIELLVMCE